MTDKPEKPEGGKTKSAWTSPTAIAGAAIGSAAIAAALLYVSRRKDRNDKPAAAADKPTPETPAQSGPAETD